MRKTILFFFCVFTVLQAGAAFPDNSDKGYDLWLNYAFIEDDGLQEHYTSLFKSVYIQDTEHSDAIRHELLRFTEKALGITPRFVSKGNQASLSFTLLPDGGSGGEGFSINNSGGKTSVEASSGAGLLYGAFHLIRMMQCGERLDGICVTEKPAMDYRLLNHWDNLNGTIGRGYAGRSLWKWDELPGRLDPRYTDYARANAAVGINGSVLNEVNSDPRMLRSDYLEKIAALAGVFRRYNIKVYIAANFAAPLKPSSTPDAWKNWGGIGTLDTADPLNPEVIKWWSDKAAEIYALIPDFGGFLVKANSEGMPGPQDYGRTHADGANMLARALKPHGGIVMWRTFVYDHSIDPDRSKHAYMEFMPLDGRFEENVILQTKNGPLDFQPIEPVSPLFGAMKKSVLAPELQITQEYLGHSTYLVYLLPMWRQFFDFDTYAYGKGSTVSELMSTYTPAGRRLIAGVANTGDSPNWTGHHFAQANWYAFGRLAWNPQSDDEQTTREWIRCTWNADRATEETMLEMMNGTWEAFAAGSAPYALGLTTDLETHYRAAFPFRIKHRYWFINETGLGTDRTSSGSDYVSQYPEPNRSMFDNIETCPENMLLHFHFVPWNHRMKSGLRFAEELMSGFGAGVAKAERNIILWESLKGVIDSGRYEDVRERLLRERDDAAVFHTQATDFFGRYIYPQKQP